MSYGITQTIFCETAPAIGSGHCPRPLPPYPLQDAALLTREANRQGPSHLRNLPVYPPCVKDHEPWGL